MQWFFYFCATNIYLKCLKLSICKLKTLRITRKS